MAFKALFKIQSNQILYILLEVFLDLHGLPHIFKNHLLVQLLGVVSHLEGTIRDEYNLVHFVVLPLDNLPTHQEVRLKVLQDVDHEWLVFLLEVIVDPLEGSRSLLESADY